MLVLATLLSAYTPQTTEAPEAFVRSIYAHYQSKMPNYSGKEAEAVFSPSLVQLIRKGQASATGFIGDLYFDPICSCNDVDGLTVESIAITSLDQNHALATVVLSFGNASRESLHLNLIASNGDWRVDDVSSTVVTSLRKLLNDRNKAG